MPRKKQKCIKCNTTSSFIWRKTEDKKALCNACFLKPVAHIFNNANVTTENVNIKIDAKIGQTKNTSRRKPKCDMCKTTSSTIWQKTEDEKELCNSCFLYPPSTSASSSNVKKDASVKIDTIKKNTNVKNSTNVAIETSAKTEANIKNGSIAANPLNYEDAYGFNFRKSTRAKSSKFRPGQLKSNNLKAKSRRNIFKKVCFKSPTVTSTPVTVETVFYGGHYYQIGDVVSCIDFKNKTYYAQIRGLIQDQFGEKSAVLTWLLPTTLSPKDRFDSTTYVAGPDDCIPRKMACFEFICHAPIEYFKPRTSPYPVLSEKPESGFIWTTVGQRIENCLVLSKEKLLGRKSS